MIRLLLVLSLLLLACEDSAINGTSPYIKQYPENIFYITFQNNSNDNISFDSKGLLGHLTVKDINYIYEGSDNHFINKIYPEAHYYRDDDIEFWGVDFDSVKSATIKAGDNRTIYGKGGSLSFDYNIDEPKVYRDVVSFEVTIDIDNVSRKIVGIPEKIYRKIYDNKSDDFFDNVIYYGILYRMELYGREWDKDNVTQTYNPCSHTHFALANYANIMKNFRYHIVVNINSKDDITLSLGGISELSSSGYDNTRGICKLYEENAVYYQKLSDNFTREVFANFPNFPNSIMEEYKLNGSKLFPDNLTGRMFVEYTPDNFTFIRFGAE